MTYSGDGTTVQPEELGTCTLTRRSVVIASNILSYCLGVQDPIKTLDGTENAANDGVDKSQQETEKDDSAKSNDAAAEAPSNGDKNEESAEKAPAEEGKSGAKRKLGEDNEKAADPVVKEASKEVGGYEDELEDVPGDATEGEGRARKRTKTTEEGKKAEDK